MIKLVTPPVVSWPWSPRLLLSSFVGAAASPGGPGAGSVDRIGALSRGPGPYGPRGPFAWRGGAGRDPVPVLLTIDRIALGVWAVATTALVLWQTRRVVHFRRRFRRAVPAPGWLADEARRLGDRFGVHAPEIVVLPVPMTPMLWFLGRPRLLVPASLVETLGIAAWRGVLAHELAHLVRRDHWIRRLEVVAGLIWWWNPLYWFTRRRLDTEAELACDERAVLAFPKGRLAYAEALLEVCRSLSMAEPPVPVLGVAGAGRFLERRVTTILRERGPSRTPARVLAGVGLLTLLALPGWTVPQYLELNRRGAAASARNGRNRDGTNSVLRKLNVRSNWQQNGGGDER